MNHLIWSQDEFLAAELADRFAGRATANEEVVVLECATAEVPGLEEALFAPSLFASKRYVVLRGAERLGKPAIEHLRERLAAGTDAEVAVVATSDRPPSLVGALEGTVKVHRALRPRRGELVAWVEGRFKANGLDPTRDASASLVEVVGNGLRDLAQAVEQLATRLGGSGAVTREDVVAQFPPTAEQPMWALFDAVIAHDGPKAFRILHQTLAQGDDAMAILFSIVSQVRHVIRARSALERSSGISDQELSRVLGVSAGRAGVLRRQSGRLGWPWLLAAHAALSDADIELKGGEKEGAAPPSEVVLERVVARLLEVG
jgi:DNA polymerase III subunit delta